MGQRCARERLCPGAVEKRTHPQTLIALLNILRFPTAPGQSRWPEAAHVWVEKRAYSAKPRMNRHSLQDKLLEVFEVFAVGIIAAGLSGPQKPPLSG